MNTKSNYRWFVLFVGVLAQATFALSFAGIPVTGILMRSAYHFTVVELGAVFGSMGLGVALSEVIWGLLTDKLGDKKVLVMGLWLAAIVFLIIALKLTPDTGSSVNYFEFCVMLMLSGAFGGSINSSSGHTIMAWFDDNERGFAMSIRQTAIPIGAALGTVLLPWLADSYGFKTTFLMLALLGLLVGLFVLCSVQVKYEAKIFERKNSQISSPLKNVDVWRITLVAGFLTIPQMSVLSFGSVYLHDHLGLGLVVISTTLAIIQLGGGTLRIWSGYYTDKRKNRIPLLKKISITCGISAIALCFLTNQPLLAILFFLITGLLSNAWQGIAYTEIAVKAGTERAGTALGMIGMAVFLSSFLSPLLVSTLLTFTSWGIIWVTIGLLTLLALLFFNSTRI